jgi:hypothetical protein
MRISKGMVLLIILSSIIIEANTQSKLPTIKAKSSKVDIKIDGKSIYEDFNNSWWGIVPETKPDVFQTDQLGSTISFHTDLDSISTTITEDTKFDFIIVLKSDSAYTQILYVEPYLKTLRKGAEFDSTQQRDIPHFTYLKQKDKHLEKLRKDFKLDSIAGGGNDVSKLIYVMHWVHNLIRHDGSSDNPTLRNAEALIKVCESEKRGVNCRMMATILNECYLSMGYKSRMVTCLPKPLEFDDCHVINTVYLEDEKRWIWLDPTFDAYVMDETGQLLGLQEVRERLIQNKPLIINPDANWNRKFSQSKEYYLENYMAKNLYRLEVPLHSTYNYETKENGKIIESVQLLPLDGINQTPSIQIVKDEKNNVTYKTYITNNPSVFWEY